MTKPDPNQLAVENLRSQVFNLPLFVRGQINAVRAQMTMLKNNEAQAALLGTDEATIEGALESLEAAATTVENGLNTPANSGRS